MKIDLDFMFELTREEIAGISQFVTSSNLRLPSTMAAHEEETQMKQNRFPKGWNEARVREVLNHYESQTEDEAVAEDEAAFRKRTHTVMVVPKRLVPAVIVTQQDNSQVIRRITVLHDARAPSQPQGR